MLADGRVLIVGGLDNLGQFVGQAEVYDPGSNTLVPSASLAVPRWGHTSTLLNSGRVLVTGGYTSAAFTILA